jgi:hypothetical protein
MVSALLSDMTVRPNAQLISLWRAERGYKGACLCASAVGDSL